MRYVHVWVCEMGGVVAVGVHDEPILGIDEAWGVLRVRKTRKTTGSSRSLFQMPWLFPVFLALRGREESGRDCLGGREKLRRWFRLDAAGLAVRWEGRPDMGPWGGFPARAHSTHSQPDGQ